MVGHGLISSRRLASALTVCVAAITAGTTAAYASDYDSQPPQVVGSVSVVPSTVDVSTSSQSVTVQTEIADAGGSGTSSVSFMAFAPDYGTNYQRHDANASLVSGTSTGGVWQTTLPFSTSDEPGDWTVHVATTDANNNHAVSDVVTHINVTSSHSYDSQPPQVVGSVSVVPSTVDVSTS